MERNENDASTRPWSVLSERLRARMPSPDQPSDARDYPACTIQNVNVFYSWPMQFWTGVSGGFAAAALLLQLWFASHAHSLQLMYRDFRAAVPTTTRLVLHPMWAWGTPLLITVLLGWMLTVRTRRPMLARNLALITAVAAVAIFAVSYWASQAPIHALAGNIRD